MREWSIVIAGAFQWGVVSLWLVDESLELPSVSLG